MLTRRSYVTGLLALGALPLLATRMARAAEREVLTVFSSNGVTGLLDELGTRFERDHRVQLQIHYDTNQMLSGLIERGTPFDMAILTRAGADRFAKKGMVTLVTDIARSGLGVAVRAGLPVPDVSSVPALERALRTARSIAFSTTGGSGIYTAQLLQRLGIAEELKPKITRPTSQQIAAMIEDGQIDLIVQQISEIHVIRGAQFAGPLPTSVQFETTFTACVATHAAHPTAARTLVEYLRAPANASVIRDKWLQSP